MSEDFKFKQALNNGLTSVPQDFLKNSKKDVTSVFGNCKKDYLKEIYTIHSSENFNTPFSYDNIMKNVFIENYSARGQQDIDDEGLPSLEFEC